jgi:4-hydroxy-tetrahydrodipicolinate synthase
VSDLVEAILKYPVTPAVKALLSYRSKESHWLTVRPPLFALSPAEMRDLGAAYDALLAG